MNRIFINYRRDDAIAFAGRIYDALCDEFGSSSVFIDSAELRGGRSTWREQLERELANCSALVVVVGPTWLTQQRDGQLRLEHPDDVVVHEITYAMENGKPVHIVVQDETPLLEPSALPEQIRAIGDLQQRRVRNDAFSSDIRRLVEDLRAEMGLSLDESGSPGSASRSEVAPLAEPVHSVSLVESPRPDSEIDELVDSGDTGSPLALPVIAGTLLFAFVTVARLVPTSAQGDVPQSSFWLIGGLAVGLLLVAVMLITPRLRALAGASRHRKSK